MIYPDRAAAWIDEACAVDTFALAQANVAAEASAKRFSEAGGAGVVLRLGWFYRAGARHSEECFALARRHIAVVIGPPRDGPVFLRLLVANREFHHRPSLSVTLEQASPMLIAPTMSRT